MMSFLPMEMRHSEPLRGQRSAAVAAEPYPLLVLSLHNRVCALWTISSNRIAPSTSRILYTTKLPLDLANLQCLHTHFDATYLEPTLKMPLPLSARHSKCLLGRLSGCAMFQSPQGLRWRARSRYGDTNSQCYAIGRWLWGVQHDVYTDTNLFGEI